MIDRSIPFYNTMMRCDEYPRQTVKLPMEYRIVSLQPGLECDWARMECAVGDFESEKEAADYFRNTYIAANRPNDIFFLLNEDGKAVGSCIAWTDQRNGESVNSLHWLIVDEDYQGRGLGRALCGTAVNRFYEHGGGPIYIHTQPWSYKAILLYDSLGFRLLKKDFFAAYQNQYEDAVKTLRSILSPEQMERLVNRAID